MKLKHTIVTLTMVTLAIMAASIGLLAQAVAQGQATDAQVVSYGTDKDTFNRGEKATGFITIKNTGNTVISDVTASVAASRALPIIGAVTVGGTEYPFPNPNLQPGETKRFEFSVDIPAEYRGISTAGDYTLHVTVKTGGQEIGSFSRSVKIA